MGNKTEEREKVKPCVNIQKEMLAICNVLGVDPEKVMPGITYEIVPDLKGDLERLNKAKL